MNKKLIAILTLVMFAVTLLPMGAFAASENRTTGTVGTFSAVQDDLTMATIRISGDGIAGNITEGQFTVTLSSGVRWTEEAPTVNLLDDQGDAVVTSDATATASRASGAAGVMTVELENADPEWLDNNAIIITIPTEVDITSVGTGDITATIEDVSTGVSSEVLTIGRFTVGAAQARALSAPSKGDGIQTFGTIRITENTAGALSTGETVTLRLPQGMTWAGGTSAANVAGTAELDLTDGAGERTGTFTVSNASGAAAARSIIDIVTEVNIDSSTARLGDINVSIGGSANIETSTVRIGRYGDFAVSVNVVGTPEDILSGKEEQTIADVEIREGLAGSILPNRTIRFSLPSGARFAEGQTLTMTRLAGSNIIDGTGNFNSSRTEVTFNTLPTATGSATRLELRDVDVEVAANFEGELEMQVSGSAGLTGSVVVANVTKPVTVSSEGAVNIQIGKQAQKVNDITMTETQAEALTRDGEVVLRLPVGATWSRVPTVTVTEGDLEVDSVQRASDNRNVTFTIDTESFEASTIVISDLYVTTDRSIAEGNVSASVTGTALRDEDVSFTNRNTTASVVVATVVTPAVDGIVQPVTMTVGSTVYTVGGVEMTMDVAPYIKDGRTFFPVRFVSQAVGISNDNVIWDGPSQTVTIFRGNRIVQMTIGSTTMLVNGTPVTMDVAPEITASRTMLPIRFLGQGLGLTVNWDAATQTVTLN